MRHGRWIAVPIVSTVVLLVLLALRIRIVIQRTGHWSGETCVIGPYNPAERTYLYVITAVFVLTVVSAVVVAVRTGPGAVRWTAIALLALCAVIGLYLLTVWGGLESNNKPIPEEPCPTLKERHANE
ncbi:hypothetical protein GPX89_05265 [Nocardia sp. ET3-3]|uniref:Uncharacterized protein n=1 Tax=Nocardia terrae TaxID=2675851 RepID=A0A7K1UQP6_9NOCA|nr:hypothetical protein [Nocardia terrae]MVU76654.1 hypothetical protein [Nocardia terrae]